jgi:hypothetical protein
MLLEEVLVNARFAAVCGYDKQLGAACVSESDEFGFVQRNSTTNPTGSSIRSAKQPVTGSIHQCNVS